MPLLEIFTNIAAQALVWIGSLAPATISSEGNSAQFCQNPIDNAAVLRALPPLPRSVPYVFDVFRDDMEISVVCLVDEVNAPRTFPLIGTAQLHHCHYKCTVYFTENVQSQWPIPFQTSKRRVEVVYIDRDHLHVYSGTPE